MGRRLALLIATYEYDDTGLRRLTAPARDADLLAEVLRDERIAGFEVTALVNQPHHRVGEAIGDFYRERRSDDLTLLYLTGHGLKDDEGRLYLAMKNTRRDSLLFTAVAAEQIDQAMEGCVCQRKVLILDCCYSGAYPDTALAKGETSVHTLERFQGRGRTVLTASDATQYSFEGDQPHGQAAPSVFTRHLVAGLRDGSADLDGDGDITLDELYSYVHDHVVAERPQQRPKKQDSVQGRTVIAQNANWALPPYLQNAITSPIAADRLGALAGLDHLYRIGNPVVRGTVLEQFARLAQDDSRQVSAAAQSRLDSGLPPPPQAPPPLMPPPPASAPPEPVATPGIPDPVGPSEVTGRRWWPRTRRRWPSPRHGWRLALTGWQRIRSATSLPTVAGLLALTGGLLFLGATGWTVRSSWTGGSWSFWPPAAWPARVPWPVTVMALVAIVAGAGVFRAGLRSVWSPGLLIGAGAGSIGGLVFTASQLIRARTMAEAMALAGYLALLVAGTLAAATVRDQGVVKSPRLPRDRLSWALVVPVGASVTAMILQLQDVARRRVGTPSLWGLGDEVRADIVATGLAVGIPLWALTLLPPRLARAALVGWAGAVTAQAFAFPHSMSGLGGSFGLRWLIVGTAVLLASTAVIWARHRPETPAPDTPAPEAPEAPEAEPLRNRRRRLALVALLLLPLLGAGTAIGATTYAAHTVGPSHSVADLAVAPDGSKLYALTLTLPPRQRFPDAGQSVPGAVSVLDPQTGRTLGGPIEVGRTPSALAVSRDGASLYVANEDSVSVISTLENAALGAPIPIAGRPRSITLNADGSAAFVVTKDSLITIDTSTNRVRGVPVPLGADPGSAVVSPDGARIYVSHPDQGTVSVLDTVTGKPAGKPAGKPLPVQGRPGRMAVSADGGTLFVVSTATDQRSSTLLALDLPAGGKVLGAVELDSFTLELALSSNGRRGYVDDLTGGVSVIDTRLMARVGTPTQVDGSPWDIVLSPDDSRLYVATFEGTIAVLNTTDPTTVTDLDVTFD